MEALVDKGLAKNIGVSNWEISHFMRLELWSDLKYFPQVNQLEFHPYYQRRDIIRYCQQRGVVITGHSTLGGSANVWTHLHQFKLMEDPTVAKIAADVNRSPAQVLLRFCIQR